MVYHKISQKQFSHLLPITRYTISSVLLKVLQPKVFSSSSFCNGQAAWFVSFLYDITFWWLTLKWIDFNHCQVEWGKSAGRKYQQHGLSPVLQSFQHESCFTCTSFPAQG